MNHVDLFSGISGFALASSWVWGEEYVSLAHSEVEKFPCQVYHKHFPESECLGDITKIDWTRFRGRVDLVTGGFPCQPFSVAGKRGGTGDDRYLWPAMFEAIRGIRPRFVLAENVPGLDGKTHLALDKTIDDLEGEGYEVAPPFWIPALAVGAWHKRERIWIVAHARDTQTSRQRGNGGEVLPISESIRLNGGSNYAVANPKRDRFNGAAISVRRRQPQQEGSVSSGGGKNIRNTTISRLPDWSGGEMGQPKPITEFERPDGREIERDFRGVAHGVRNRVDRLKSLGNAIVPQCAEVILRAIKELNGPNR